MGHGLHLGEPRDHRIRLHHPVRLPRAFRQAAKARASAPAELAARRRHRRQRGRVHPALRHLQRRHGRCGRRADAQCLHLDRPLQRRLHRQGQVRGRPPGGLVRARRRAAAMTDDIYTRVTNDIIAALERGTPPWVRPWSAAADPQPINASTRRPYRGLNVLTLQLHATAQGYARNVWLTLRQANDLGARVRRGEHGVPVVFWKLRKVDARAETQPWPDEQEVHEKVVPLLRTYTVFNVAQLNDLPAHLLPAPAPVEWEPEAAAEDVLIRSQVEIRYGGDRAYYRPDGDFIQLPERGAFRDSASFYATALHEVLHATGHPRRLNRDFSGRWGDQAYAFEELVAEIGSAFLCAACRIDGELQHPAYVASWLRVLRGDPKAIFSAATKAQQGADLVWPYVDPITADAVKEAA